MEAGRFRIFHNGFLLPTDKIITSESCAGSSIGVTSRPTLRSESNKNMAAGDFMSRALIEMPVGLPSIISEPIGLLIFQPAVEWRAMLR
jgi:hypothetical protein